MPERPLLGVTMGDPAGIGPEIVVAGYPSLREYADVMVLGDAEVLRDAVTLRGVDFAINVVEDVSQVESAPGVIDVLDFANVDEVVHGVVRAAYGRASLEYVERAADLALEGTIDGMVTAPIHKRAIREAGATHAGHTGLLTERTGAESSAMLLIAEPLRVSHVSTHVPLREACDLVRTRRVLETIELTHDALLDLGIAEPTVAVAGLNPHAGEDGLLGDAEDEEIEPAIEEAIQHGLDVEGPEPPDTVFSRAASGEADAVVAMYHDQGHIPVKTLGFEEDGVRGVNATIGLPIVRTSVDHGTAFDIADEGVADPGSLQDAVRIASQFVRGRSR